MSMYNTLLWVFHFNFQEYVSLLTSFPGKLSWPHLLTQSEVRSERSGGLLSPPLSSTTQPEGSEGTRVEGDVEGSSNVGVDSGGAGVGGGGGEKGEPEEEHPLQRLIYPLISVFQLVIRSSYIATNIVMMVRESFDVSWLLGHVIIPSDGGLKLGWCKGMHI